MASHSKRDRQLTVVDSSVRWINWWSNLRETLRYRSLLHNLVKRDIKVRYRNSILGVLWSLLNPLLMMLVFSLIFGKLMPREDIRQYAVFFLVGLLPWQFFSNSLISGTVSTTDGSNMIKKIYFPRELLPTSSVISNLVHFMLAFLVLLVFLYASGLFLTIHALWLPPLLLTQIIFTLGLAMILSTLNVFYRDVLMIIDVILLAWFFLTPVIYPLEWMGQAQTILGITFEPAQVMRWINPMASIIDGYRTVLWGTLASDGPVGMDPLYLTRTLITAIIIFILGYLFFIRFKHLFAEKL